VGSVQFSIEKNAKNGNQSLGIGFQ